MKITRKLAGFALAGTLTLSMAACGSSDEEVTPAPAPSSSAPADDEADDETTVPAGVFGPGCADVPADGAGSFDGMTTDPVATAASNNPLLSTLVTAVGEADLVDTLNSAEDITVFAPSNDAFAAVDEDALAALLADKEELTKVLTNHVVEGRISPEDLAGTFTTLNGTDITVEGSDEDFTVGDASVVCGNVQTANATVYIIDGVLLP